MALYLRRAVLYNPYRRTILKTQHSGLLKYVPVFSSIFSEGSRKLRKMGRQKFRRERNLTPCRQHMNILNSVGATDGWPPRPPLPPLMSAYVLSSQLPLAPSEIPAMG